MREARERYRQREQNAPENLPPGKTCGDCLCFSRCAALIGSIPEDEVCDWIPIRFIPKQLPGEGER